MPDKLRYLVNFSSNLLKNESDRLFSIALTVAGAVSVVEICSVAGASSVIIQLTYIPCRYISLRFCIYWTDDFIWIVAHFDICHPQITLVAQLLLLITLRFFVIAELVIVALIVNLTIYGSLDG